MRQYRTQPAIRCILLLSLLQARGAEQAGLEQVMTNALKTGKEKAEPHMPETFNTLTRGTRLRARWQLVAGAGLGHNLPI